MDKQALTKKQLLKRRVLDDIKRFETVLGAETTIEGTFKSNVSSAINGRVLGDCIVKKGFMLGETGYCSGNIVAEFVIIAGTVDGDVLASVKLEILHGAQIRGNIQAPIVAIAEGAVIKGEIKMSQVASVTRFVEKRKR